MSDNLRRYRAIRNALMQAYPAQPTGNLARHLHTLAALISGIVGSKSTQLPHIAAKAPNGTKPESRVKRFARWIDNDYILEEVYFLPYADILLHHLALQTLVLVMDGSVAGRGCNALMIHVVYKGRALPLAWRVRQGPKGHFPEDLHIARAAIGLVQLARLPKENARRSRVVTRYRDELANVAGISVPFAPSGNHSATRDQTTSAEHLFVVVLPEGVRSDDIRSALRKERIQTSMHYPPIHQFSLYAERSQRRLPVTEGVASRLLTLPLYGHMTDDQVDLVADTLLRAL